MSEKGQGASARRRKGAKATRRVFSEHQIAMLSDAFTQNPNPVKKMHIALAEQTGLSEHSVRVWFQNRRSRSKAKDAALALCELGFAPAKESARVGSCPAPFHTPPTSLPAAATNFDEDASCMQQAAMGADVGHALHVLRVPIYSFDMAHPATVFAVDRAAHFFFPPTSPPLVAPAAGNDERNHGLGTPFGSGRLGVQFFAQPSPSHVGYDTPTLSRRIDERCSLST